MTRAAPLYDAARVRSVWLNGVASGLCYSWAAGDHGGVADRLMHLRHGEGLLVLGIMLGKLTTEDRIEIGELLTKRVLFPWPR